MEKSLLFYLLHPTMPSNIMQIYKEVIYYCRKMLWPLSLTSSKLIIQKNNNSAEDEEEDKDESNIISAEDEEEDKDESTSNHETYDLIGVNCCNDVNMVMGSLGIDGWQKESGRIKDGINGNNGELELLQGIGELLDDKNASLQELKEAFCVFDRDEDGFISAFELWNVLRRLGFKEGVKYEDCEEMIRVFDKDGDDMISFQEFKNLMENSI